QQKPPEFYVNQGPAVPARPQSYDLKTVKFDSAGEAIFRKAGVDLMFLMSPFMHAFSLRLPFVMPIFDLNHKINPQFPEVSANGESNARDYMYINACRFATMIVVDSETGKSDVLRYYGDFIGEDRIRVVPMYSPIARSPRPTSADLARVRTKYKLPDRYFFYPAQFWPHKNHELILRAVRAIADETGEVTPIIFTGSYADYHRAVHMKKLQALAAELGIADRIHYLGVAAGEDMSSLFAMSVALVAPTYFGPANIPPLEAWYNGRPVIMCDLPGIREQVRDGGLLVDPRTPSDLAGAMRKLWHDEAMCTALAKRGQERVESYNWESYVDRVRDTLEDACESVRAGRTPVYPAA